MSCQGHIISEKWIFVLILYHTGMLMMSFLLVEMKSFYSCTRTRHPILHPYNICDLVFYIVAMVTYDLN